MDVIEPILSIASEIYGLVEKVKANKKRCRRVCDRVNALVELVRSIKQMGQGQISADVERPLKELSVTLKLAQDLIETYTKATWVRRVLDSGSHEDEFKTVNRRLNDAFQVLSGALQVEQGNMLRKVFELSSKEDEVDGKEDDAELQKLLKEFQKEQQEKMEAMIKEFESVRNNVEKIVAILNKPRAIDEDIRMIKPHELDYGESKKPFMTTETSEVYKGQFKKFPVAIKRYIDPLNTNPREVRKIFEKEVETMKRFESHNILRMFGICVQNENGPHPEFLLIMEYCEKGSLRQVLDKSGSSLSWITKVRMCRDAARGLYALHQAEEKSKVHGCITSSKFLVTEGDEVKLGGFELAKTETSLRKPKKTKEKDRTLSYTSPEMLKDINLGYSKESEIYSFGIVLWEVATSRRPFEGLENQDIYQKVGKEKYQEPLPECPKGLPLVINSCRDCDSFQRPSAGVLVDQLQSVLAELEKC
ncbi:mixed lineage kinase domain-like protein isoform X2 [Epinephelus moara]|uniref:mixed lineage kinase domain-like protein isoform X2 n=1 Tax=Epinephelus moara TaxID=300413 RepID=UPI00214F277D|nr:mixed lineage kinase domain-like protein isoform X2 [Epinephelus moara]